MSTKRETATVTAFMPSKFGNKVELNDTEVRYLPENVKVETGMKIKFSRHGAGEECTLQNGDVITFKVEGIHDVMIVQSANKTLALEVAAVKFKLAEEVEY